MERQAAFIALQQGVIDRLTAAIESVKAPEYSFTQRKKSPEMLSERNADMQALADIASELPEHDREMLEDYLKEANFMNNSIEQYP